MSGFVYFVSSGPSIKIGYSKQPGKRFIGLKTGSDKPLEFLGCTEGTRENEKEIQRELKNFRLGGEWFVDCAPVRNRIAVAISDGFAQPAPNAPSRDPDEGRDPYFLKLLRASQEACLGKYPPGTLERILEHRRALARAVGPAVASAEAFMREMDGEDVK